MPGKRILVIDDEDDIREVAQASLEIMAGLDVIVACSSQEGLEKAEAEVGGNRGRAIWMVRSG